MNNDNSQLTRNDRQDKKLTYYTLSDVTHRGEGPKVMNQEHGGEGESRGRPTIFGKPPQIFLRI